MMKNKIKEFRSGFVGIIGAHNAGKSTLLNQVLGQKISITSKKPQTTRNRITGVVHRPSAQLVFIDTPGIHPAKDPLNIRIVAAALSTLTDVDLVLVILDVAHPDPAAEGFLVKNIKEKKQPVILVLNKIDLIEKRNLLFLFVRHSFEMIHDLVDVLLQPGLLFLQPIKDPTVFVLH